MPTSFTTLSLLSRALGVPRHRLAYIVNKLGIVPAVATGGCYLYSRAQAVQIERALKAIRTYRRREGVPDAS